MVSTINQLRKKWQGMGLLSHFVLLLLTFFIIKNRISFIYAYS
jgi:hypothetical protein